MTTYIGLTLLLLLVVSRWAVQRWRVVRLKRWWNQGQEALNASNLVAAEAAFRQCVRIVPIAAPAHRVLGAVLARRGKFPEAEERLKFGADLEPRNAEGFVDLGFFYALCVPNREEDAINAFAAALEAAPNLRKRLAQEPSLEPLRQHERFRKLLVET